MTLKKSRKFRKNLKMSKIHLKDHLLLRKNIIRLEILQINLRF